jgi:hypothetical protein
MGSGAVIYSCIPYFIKIGSGILKLIHTRFHKDRFRHSKVNRGRFKDKQHGDLISLLLFFQNEESRLKRTVFP